MPNNIFTIQSNGQFESCSEAYEQSSKDYSDCKQSDDSESEN